MELKTRPAAREITIEIDGKRTARAESCRIRTVRELHAADTLGPGGMEYLPGKPCYALELKRVRLTDRLEDYHSLRGFTVTVLESGRRIVYSGCEWSELSENITAGADCVETMTLSASKREVATDV